MTVAALAYFDSKNDPVNGFYTESERNNPKYNVAFAIGIARRTLANDRRYERQPIDLTCVAHVKVTDKVTLRAANAIASQIAHDTLGVRRRPFGR